MIKLVAWIGLAVSTLTLWLVNNGPEALHPTLFWLFSFWLISIAVLVPENMKVYFRYSALTVGSIPVVLVLISSLQTEIAYSDCYSKFECSKRLAEETKSLESVKREIDKLLYSSTYL